MLKERVEYLFSMIKFSDFIRKNESYRKISDNIKIKLVSANTVNANARVGHINIYDGIINFSYVLSYAFVLNDFKVMSKMLSHASNLANVKNGDFTFRDAMFVISKYIDPKKVELSDLFNQQVQSYNDACITSIIAHELGHICLGHSESSQYGMAYINSISRNNERSADLFASSVAESIGFIDYMVIGNLLMTIVLAWLSSSYSEEKTKATTHPYSLERVMYTYNSHIEVYEKLGLTKNKLYKMLPELKENNETQK